MNQKYQVNEWNSSRTQGRRVPPLPPSLSTCGNSWGWNARGHVGGDPRPRQRSGAYARLDPSRQCQSRADTAGCSWLFITGGKEHYLSQWHEKERVGLERWLPVLSLFTSSSSMACLAFYFLRVFSYLKAIRMSTEFIWRVCLAIQFDMLFL